MSKKTKQVERLNECARMFYSSHGYEVPKGYDFSEAKHPQEQACFVLAVRSYNYWSREFKKDKEKE